MSLSGKMYKCNCVGSFLPWNPTCKKTQVLDLFLNNSHLCAHLLIKFDKDPLRNLKSDLILWYVGWGKRNRRWFKEYVQYLRFTPIPWNSIECATVLQYTDWHKSNKLKYNKCRATELTFGSKIISKSYSQSNCVFHILN